MSPETAQTASNPASPRAVCQSIVDAVGGVFVGDPVLLRKVLAAALANGHVLFEDYPGLGKTLLVKAFGEVLGCHSDRVQFTPDLLPGDITGTKIWDPEKRTFHMDKGPIFTNVLLADEINRAPPKTQSALLEAMEERQVTIEGETHPLEPPFFVLATQNPLEQEGTYPLPEAQMDRFLMRLSTGYPVDLAAETRILERRVSWQEDDPTGTIKPVTDLEQFRKLQRIVEEQVYVHPDMLQYLARIVRALREHPKLEMGPSPRGSLGMLRVTRALAMVQGRNFITPDDVQLIAVDCLAHRCVVEIEQALEGYEAAEAVTEVLQQLPVPTRYQKAA